MKSSLPRARDRHGSWRLSADTFKRKPGRPKGAGSQRVEYRVTDAQYAELKREGRGNANAAAKVRTFPAGPETEPKEKP